MKDILEEIVRWKRLEVEGQKAALSPREIHRMAESCMEHPARAASMSRALMEDDHGIIAEFKRKSPSKGWIKEDGKAEVIPLSYERNGAAALSILTDGKYFGGDMGFIRKARPLVTLPILRKDFIVDEYQLFQARCIGADAVLLIAAALTREEAMTMRTMARELRLEVLLEIHDDSELDYVDINADMIGVNNRNLGTFHTSVENSFRMADMLPKDKVLVSESGIGDADTIRLLRQAGYRGFLMGEHFMRAEDPGAALGQFLRLLG